MKYNFIVLLIMMTTSFTGLCQSQNIKGEVYIKPIDILDLFDDLSNEQIKQTKQIIENPNLKDEYSKVEKSLFSLFSFLYDNELLRKPHFKLKTNKGDIISVYLSREEYPKLANKLSGFDIYDQKIDLTFKGQKISEGFFDRPIFYCDELVLVERLYR